MGYGDVSVPNDGARDDVAITIFGMIPLQDSQNDKIQRVPSRIPISTDCQKRKRDSLTEQPTRDRDEECRFPQQLDLMYLTNMKNRFRSTNSCDQQRCPRIKTRLQHHQLEQHPSRLKNYHPTETSTAMKKYRAPKTSTKSGSYVADVNSVHTDVIEIHGNKYFNDVSRKIAVQDARNNSLTTTNYKYNYNAADNGIPLIRTETREILMPNRNLLRDCVEREVIEWFSEVPLYPGKGASFDKNYLIQDLTDKITILSGESSKEEGYTKIVSKIESTLNNVVIWYPGAKIDQYAYKNMLINKLLHRIKGLKYMCNTKLHYTNLTDNKNEKQIITQYIDGYTKSYHDKIENEINNWVSIIQNRQSSKILNYDSKMQIVKSIMERVTPLLKICTHKPTLKTAIIEVMNDLSISRYSSKNINLNRFVDDLANRLISIESKLGNCNINSNNQNAARTFPPGPFNNNIEYMIRQEINKCLANTRFIKRFDVIEDISNIIMDSMDSSVEDYKIRNEIFDILKNASNIPDFIALNIAKNVLEKVKTGITFSKRKLHSLNIESNLLPTRISVYTLSEEGGCSMNCLAASTPKETKKQKVISKLNPEEIEYTAKVGNLIKSWMDTLPEQFNAPDEKDFKETMINDLAGEITDAAKLEQLVSLDEKEKLLKYLVYKWLQKLDVFDLEEVTPQINNFLMKLNDIPIPLLTRPQHGNRQSMANIKHMEGEFGWQEPFVPKAADILEDEISIWMNEQSSDVIDTDKSIRNNKIHELAEHLQQNLSKNRPEQEISSDIAHWLNDIVKSNRQSNVADLANNLKNRIINLPQDITLAANRDKKVQQRAEHIEHIKNTCCQPTEPQTNNNNTTNNDMTMQQYISKFIEHNYDVGDPMARGAFSHLLKTKLQRLNPPTRKQVYNDLANVESNKIFPHENLVKELEYIKIISDWLKNIPMQDNYNTVGNKERIDFVNNLAINILEVEEQREANPDAMDYNMYMASIISQFIVQLPIIAEYKNDKQLMFLIDQLIGKIISNRNNIQKAIESIDMSGVHSKNIGEFIEEFIRVNGNEIADDEVKMEAWSMRLLKEVKKMTHDSKDATLLSKSKVYDKLTSVPIPESVNEFDNEIEYIKEISEWLKSLPLLTINESDEEERIKMICELTEKITERKTKNPDDLKEDKEFAEYVAKWISDLSLDESREVIADFVIQQLINRIDRVTNKKENTVIDFTQANESIAIKELNNQNINKCHSCQPSMPENSKQLQNPANSIVDAIEKWSASLPIVLDDENTVKSIKNDAAKKLLQKVGELNIDPRTFNDDLLYKEVLNDEVESILEKLPQNTELQNNNKELTSELVESIVEAQLAIKEKHASEFYKQKLEHVIEASFPHSVKTRKVNDPAFEIYKTHVANLFILENFDHGNDTEKLKYEKNIKHQIDKFYDMIKNRNVTLMTKDEVYNELYGALYKVPLPHKSAIIGEVEQIKTRCEIETWFEQLPLKDTNDITELLERQKIIDTLAKRIHEIEVSNIEKSHDKIHKEIVKWIVKLPLNHGEDKNVEQFAKKLLDILKLSKGHRKCIVSDPIPKVTKNKKSKAEKISRKKWANQNSLAKPKKTAAEIIIKAVEDWCNQLPVFASTPQEEENVKNIKDNLSTKILIKISELNVNPSTLNDDFLFDDLFDEELNKLLSVVPTCCDFEETKSARKIQLRDAINSVNPLLREERARHQYKQDLVKTVAKVLRKPQHGTSDQEALLSDIQDEIVENFLQYTYDKSSNEAKQPYKNNIHEGVVKFLANIDEKDESLDPLMSRNQLMCELAKIKLPSENSLKQEVEEIRMKKEISDLFDELSISDSNKQQQKLINQLKSNLAFKLDSIESNGYNADTENKMKQEVTKCLTKLNKNVKQKIIDNFIEKLKNNEIVRRAPPKTDIIDMISNNRCKSDACGNKGLPDTSNSKPDNSANRSKADPKSTPNRACNNQNPKKTAENQNSANKNSAKQSIAKADKCECYPERPRSPENVMEDNSPNNGREDNSTDTNSNIFLLRPNSIDNGERRYCNENKDFETKKDFGQDCICGGMRRRRRPCFMPMGWYCNGEDMAVCRVPAGFFYC